MKAAIRKTHCIQPSIGDGHQCDRCGTAGITELRHCRIEGTPLAVAGEPPRIRLCLPCIGQLSDTGVRVHVLLSPAELRKQMRVIRPRTHGGQPQEMVRVAEDLQRQIDALRKQYKRLHATVGGEPYPDVPPPRIKPSKTGKGLPQAPGIYFVWQDDLVEYVGQSVVLCNRAKLGHERIRPGHRLSFVPIDRRDLDWAECWYIGKLRPILNFGSRAAHACSIE